MKTLSIAFGLALLAIAAAFAFLSLLGVEHSVAGSIAAAIIGGVPHIRELLDKQLASRKNPQENPVLPLGRFGLTRARLVLNGALMIFAAMLLTSGFGGILAGILDIQHHQTFVPALAATYLVVFPAVFLVGRWVGRRSVTNGLITVFLIGLFVRSGATIFDMVTMSSEDFSLLLNGLGERPVLWQAALQILIGTFLFFALGALGYWRGKHHRLGSYLGYLLRNVPETTQHIIVELAFEEASRASNIRSIAQASNPTVSSDVQLGTARAG